MIKKLILILSLVWGISFTGYAQISLSLNGYKQKVLSYNQDIKIAQNTINAAQAVSKEIKTGYLPGIDASGSYSYNFNPVTLSLGNPGEEMKAQNWSAGGEVNQILYSGGKLSASYNAAKIQQDIASLMQESTVDNISYSAETSYWNAVATLSYLNTATRYKNILTDLYKTVQKRFDDGLISKTDLLKVETSLKEADYQLSKAQQLFNNTCIILNILMGEPENTSLQLTDSISDPSSMIVEYLTFDDVLNRRPDYLIKSKEIDLQKQQGKIDLSEFLPKAHIGASVNYGTLMLNFDGKTQWTPLVYANISIPVFHWGKSKFSQNKNKAIEISKELEQDAAADNIKKELGTTLNNIKETGIQIIISKDNLKTAEESLELHTFSYQEGQVSILDVQSVQLSWLQAYVNLIESYLNNKLSIARYKKVISE